MIICNTSISYKLITNYYIIVTHDYALVKLVYNLFTNATATFVMDLLVINIIHSA